jgi:hypothetical protein
MSIHTLWYRSTSSPTIAGYPCIKHKLTGELCIVGKHGEIWEYSETKLALMSHSTKVTNKIADLLGIRPPPQDKYSEAVLVFDANKINEVAELLKCTPFSGRQLTRLKTRYTKNSMVE